jgi:hypothetical protein
VTGARAALLLVALAVAGCGSSVAPAGSATAPSAVDARRSPKPSPSSTPFASSRYGYRLDLPTGWRVTETPGSGGVHPDEPVVDTFRDGVGFEA